MSSSSSSSASSSPTTSVTTSSSTSPSTSSSAPSSTSAHTLSSGSTSVPSTTATTPPSSSASSTSDAGSTSPTATLSTISSSTLSPSSSSTLSQSSSTSLFPTSTIVATTMITTDAQGQSFTTILSTLVPTSTTSSSPSGGGGSHTGAIVGGTIGGVVALILLGVLGFFCFRKRRKDDFDGNFDPGRVAHEPPGQLDLTAGEVEPYTYPHDTADMREGGQLPYAGPVTGAGVAGAHDYHDVAHPGSQYTDVHPSPYLSPTAAGTTAYSTTPSPPRSAKEREAFARYHDGAGSSTGASGSTGPGMQVANQHDGDQIGATSPVVVHQDGGRVSVPLAGEDDGREIPPTYDSIPAHEAGRY